MSASITLHGPFTAGARLIRPGAYLKEPFVSLDIHTKGAGVTLVTMDTASLESLSAALGEARVLLASITGPPEYEPDDREAQRIAEVFADARAEQDRGL